VNQRSQVRSQESEVGSQHAAYCLPPTAYCPPRYSTAPRHSSPYINLAICLPFGRQRPLSFLPVGAILDIEHLNFLPVGIAVGGIAGFGSPRAPGKSHGGGVRGREMVLGVKISS